MVKRDETLQMARFFRSGRTMQQIGDYFGISRQAVQQRLAAIGITARDRPSRHTLIDKGRLEALYKENLSIEKICEEFGVGDEIIRQALLFYQISKRGWIRTGGCRVDVLKKLEIGEKYKAVFSRKKPHALIYMPAKRIGIKVSIRTLGDGRFEITRTG